MENLRNGFVFHADQLVVYKKGESFARTAFALVVRVGGDLYLVPEEEKLGRYPVDLIEDDMVACIEPNENNEILEIYGPRDDAEFLAENGDPGIFCPHGRKLYWDRKEAEQMGREKREREEREKRERDALSNAAIVAERRQKFAEVIGPVVDFLRSSVCHPHMTIVVTCQGAELLEGIVSENPKFPEDQEDPEGSGADKVCEIPPGANRDNSVPRQAQFARNFPAE